MRALNIQIQTGLEPSLDLARVRSILGDLSKMKPLVESATHEEGGEQGLFLNYTYQTADIAKLWAAVQAQLLSAPHLGEKLRNCSTIIASREGAGWDNYLLLHHFDPYIEKHTLV